MDSSLDSPGVVALASKLKSASGAERGLTYWASFPKGEARELKSAKVRGRYERLARSAMDLGALHVELRATDGGVFAVVVIEEDDDESPAVAAAPVHVQEARGDVNADAVRAMVKVVLDAQDVAVQRQQQMMTQVMNAALNVMKVASERTSALERSLLLSLGARERELAQGFQLLAEQSAEIQTTRDEVAAEREASGPADEMATKLMDNVVFPAMAAKALEKMNGGKKA